MKQVSIIRNGVVTNQAQFGSMEEAEAWLSSHDEMKTFGDRAQTVEQQVEVSPAVVAEDGSELAPAQYEIRTVELPGYQLEIVDISDKLQQERINAESLAYLVSTDWMVTRFAETGVAIPEDIRVARAAARAAIVK